MARRTSSLFPSKKTPKIPVPTTTNMDGFPSYEGNLQEQYLQTLLTNMLKNTFYADSRKMQDMSADLHKKMAAKDPAFMGKALIYARQKGFMRTNPIYGLAVLAGVDGPFFEQTFAGVIRTPNDLADFFTILASLRNGSQGGRKVKRVAGQWIRSHISEYWAIKYGSDKGDGDYSLKDLIMLTHPKGPALDLIDWLFDRKVKQLRKKLPQIAAFEDLKQATTAKDKAAAIVEGKLPHEVATSFAGDLKTVWDAIVPNMPIFALLKNLNTLDRHEVLTGDTLKSVLATFRNKEQVQKSKILPYRFVEAIKHVTNTKVQEALRDALELSFANVPEIHGETAVLLDCSPSMFPPYRTDGMFRTAAIFSAAVLKKTQSGTLIGFDKDAFHLSFVKGDTLMTQVEKLEGRKYGGGTNQAAAIDLLLDGKEKVDNIIVVTDGEQNSGRPFMEALQEYRLKVNKKVKVFIIDVSPYLNAIVPVNQDNTWYLYGWSDSVLNVIGFASEGLENLVSLVKGNFNPEA